MHPIPMAIASQPEMTGKTQDTTMGTTPTVRPTNTRLPQFDQVMEVANLQPQNATNHLEQKDPLNKYSRGITKAVHDAYLS